MTEHNAIGNVASGHSTQFNGPIYGNVGPVIDLQPSFFKTSQYESYKDINPPRVAKACLWFLEHPIFQKWKASNCDDLLWLSADPGCGKSVLSRALIDEKLVGADSGTLCYFFFKDNDEQNNTTTVLCALLHQLIWTRDDLLRKYVAPAIKKCGEALKKDFEELWRTFTSAATDPSTGNVVCILDALDECQEADRNKLINYLEVFYTRSVDTPKQGSSLKFLVTSRAYSGIERGFSKLIQNIPTIRLAGEDESGKISDEIGIVIEAKAKEIAETCKLGDDLRSSLQRRLFQIPNRTYLWLHLTLEEVKSEISRGKTETKLLTIINTLSSTVEEAYEKILNNCPREEARKTLQIIVAARRPLTLSEVDVALEIESDSTSSEDLDYQGDSRKESIRHNCGLFISIVDSHVYLIHETAKEFLVRKNNALSGPQRWKHSIDLQAGHRVLSEKCITYLLFREFEQHPGSTEVGASSALDRRSATKAHAKNHAFLNYSANYWVSHVQESGISSSRDWITKTAKLCDIGDGSSCAWSVINSTVTWDGLFSIYKIRQSALYWAVVLGLVHETRYFLEGGVGCDNQEESVQDILLKAVKNNGHGKELTELLLDRREDEVQITTQVVEAAAANQKSGKDIMALLLDRQVDQFEMSVGTIAAATRSFDQHIIGILLDRRGDEVQITTQVVEAAAANQKSGRDIMALLLDRRGDEVQITEQVVMAAAQNSSSGEDIMTLLLDRRGDEVQITEEVVMAAAENWRSGEDIMVLLLDRRGDEVQITEEVVMAAAKNHESGKDIMALLLDRRGDKVQITEEVVKAAAENLSSGGDIITLLLDRRGDKVQITEQVTRTAARSHFYSFSLLWCMPLAWLLYQWLAAR